MALRHVLALFSSIVPTGCDVEPRVTCDRGSVEMAMYKVNCGAHSCVSMERMESCEELGDHTTRHCQDWHHTVVGCVPY